MSDAAAGHSPRVFGKGRSRDKEARNESPDRKVLLRNLSFFKCPNPSHKAHLCAKNHNRTLQPPKRHHQCMHHVSNSRGHHAWGMVVVVVVTVISHVLSQTRMHQSKKQRQNSCVGTARSQSAPEKSFFLQVPQPSP